MLPISKKENAQKLKLKNNARPLKPNWKCLKDQVEELKADKGNILKLMRAESAASYFSLEFQHSFVQLSSCLFIQGWRIPHLNVRPNIHLSLANSAAFRYSKAITSISNLNKKEFRM
jgi:hypothetical protein